LEASLVNGEWSIRGYRTIEDAGGWPEIRYYDRHGWRIVDLRKSPAG
jgi:hypothetical protein